MYIVIEEFRGLGFWTPVKKVEITVFSDEREAVVFAKLLGKSAYIVTPEEGETIEVYAEVYG